MQRSVWKYTLPISNEPHELKIPGGTTRVLTVGQQHGKLMIWCEVYPDGPMGSRWFQVVGTGNLIPDTSIHVGTAFIEPFVWHIYELTRSPK